MTGSTSTRKKTIHWAGNVKSTASLKMTNPSTELSSLWCCVSLPSERADLVQLRFLDAAHAALGREQGRFSLRKLSLRLRGHNMEREHKME